MKRKTKLAKGGPAALLVISNKDGVEAAAKAIIAVLSVGGQEPATLQEAMRTLAVMGMPPQNVTVSECTFSA